MSNTIKNPAALCEDVQAHGIRVSKHTNVDAVLVGGAPFVQPDGSFKVELAIGVVEGDFKCGYVPVLDVLKFALTRGGDELLKRALLETGMTRDICRIADEADMEFDMQSEG